MKAIVAAFNQEKALVGAFSVIVQPVVEPMEHYTALRSPCTRGRRWPAAAGPRPAGRSRGAGAWAASSGGDFKTFVDLGASVK